MTTVKELIEALQKLPADTKVCVKAEPDHYNTWEDVDLENCFQYYKSEKQILIG